MNSPAPGRASDAKASHTSTIPTSSHTVAVDIQEAFQMAREWDTWANEVQVIDRRLLEHRMLDMLRIARTQQSCIMVLKADRDTCFMLLSEIGYESEKVVDNHGRAGLGNTRVERPLDQAK